MNIKEAADSLYAREEITKEQHEELVKIAAHPFKSKILLKGLEKLKKNYSKFKEGGKSVLDTASKAWELNPIFGLAAIGAGGAVGKEMVIDPATQLIKIKKSFNKMIEKTPQLAEADQTKLRDYFGVVKSFSPKAASNPLVAGSLVNKMMQFEGVDHKLVQDIASLQAGMPAPRIAPTAAENAAKSITSLPKKFTAQATAAEIANTNT